MTEMKESTGKKSLDQLSIEETFAYVDRVLAALERKDISLEDSFMAYRKGVQAIQRLNQMIDGVEKKVQMLDAENNLTDFELLE